MDARNSQPRPAPSLAGAILSQLSFPEVSLAHPRAFFVVHSTTSSLRTFEGVRMSTSQPLPPEPKTPSRTGGAANATQQSVHSTPVQVSARTRILNAKGVADSGLHGVFIQDAYPDHTRWNVDVDTFVNAVFGFDWKDILPHPCGQSGEYTLSADDVQDFLNTSKETATYEPFCKVGNALLSQLYGDVGPTDTSRAQNRRKAIIEHRAKKLVGGKVPVRTYVGKLGARAAEAVGEHGLREKPDLTYGLEDTRKPDWRWVTVAMEVERGKEAMAADRLSDILLKEQGGAFVVLDNPGILANEANARGVGKGHSKKPKAQPQGPSAGPSRQSQGPSNSGTQPVSGAGSSAGKRKLDTLGSQASTESSSKRPKTSTADKPIIHKEAQLLKYLTEVMSHNVRSYAIGWLIQDDKLRLVYGDRMGVVFTKPIEFFGRDANLFLLVVAAMGAAGVHELGIHPNVHYPRLRGDEPWMCRDVFDKEHGYEGATLHVEGQGEDGSGVLEYDFDVDKKAHRSVYTEFGLIGRGTTVIPVKARPGAGAASGAQASESEELVAKIAWPHAARTGEDVFIRKVRSRLKNGGKKKILQHIVDLKASMTKDMKEMNMPRHAMGLCPDEQDVRVCRILILKCYRPLDAIGSPAEFHLVFVQVFRAHHWVYVTSKVLHCDISMNNIMWYRRGDEIIGVLCDWDLAEDQENGERRAVNIGQSQHLPSQPSNQQDVEPPAATSENNAKPRYRTGTGPFMAVELLLSNPPPAHKYRYDVESFFYVYVCGAATYRADRDRKIVVINNWNYESLRRIGNEKTGFLKSMARYEKVFEGAHADFKPAIGSFLYKMWFAFGEVSLLSTEIEMIVDRRRGLPTLEDEKMIAGKKQEQDDQITYQAFMKMMGEPELLPEASESPSA
ncbi:hypothetical protein FOMPIDRAFT_1060536 [Fomitopsis schrenkii]|uniref:Fungal-type protein kinase domain-containing protein n=1 Tax=Fomitopsis schrenkii TaxID=2126942 RepID=S8E6D9_FOMSC|nr:hypothetical protein FOMPIDRAFT_1060536 [Fomitopsis schrenkii]